MPEKNLSQPREDSTPIGQSSQPVSPIQNKETGEKTVLHREIESIKHNPEQFATLPEDVAINYAARSLTMDDLHKKKEYYLKELSEISTLEALLKENPAYVTRTNNLRNLFRYAQEQKDGEALLAIEKTRRLIIENHIKLIDKILQIKEDSAQNFLSEIQHKISIIRGKAPDIEDVQELHYMSFEHAVYYVESDKGEKYVLIGMGGESWLYGAHGDKYIRVQLLGIGISAGEMELLHVAKGDYVEQEKREDPPRIGEKLVGPHYSLSKGKITRIVKISHPQMHISDLNKIARECFQ